MRICLTRLCRAFALFGLSLMMACTYAEDDQTKCPVPLVKNAALYGQAMCPKLGLMGKTHLAVPQHYLLGPFTYSGVDVWSNESWEKRPRNPTFEREIGNFAIKIRHNNFQPILNREDWRAYAELGKTVRQSSENHWIHVGVKNLDVHFPRLGKPYYFPIKSILEPDSFGKFTLQKEKAWGLDHYINDQKIVVNPLVEHSEYFFDSISRQTLIRCSTRLRAAPPHDPLTSCTHEFVSFDGQAMIDVDNIWDKTDIARWREVEMGIQAIYRSFIYTRP